MLEGSWGQQGSSPLSIVICWNCIEHSEDSELLFPHLHGSCWNYAEKSWDSRVQPCTFHNICCLETSPEFFVTAFQEKQKMEYFVSCQLLVQKNTVLVFKLVLLYVFTNMSFFISFQQQPFVSPECFSFKNTNKKAVHKSWGRQFYFDIGEFLTHWISDTLLWCVKTIHPPQAEKVALKILFFLQIPDLGDFLRWFNIFQADFITVSWAI